MNLWEAIKLGLENILLHKLRALLTMLGMVFGVAAVVGLTILIGRILARREE